MTIASRDPDMSPVPIRTRAPAIQRLLILLATLAAGMASASGAPAGMASASAAPAATLAARYPGDRGMARDPAVVLYEDFTEGSVAAVLGRYTTYENRDGMALVADHPAGSPGPYALRLTSGGRHASTYLYRSFGIGYEELYFRYYAKYIGDGPWHHTGVWIGGYSPPLPYPYPRAGLRPAGDDLYSIGLEPIPALPHVPMDLYTYWRGMHSWRAAPTGARGDYFGNTLLHDARFVLEPNRWVCYEMHLKLNPDPASGAGAVLEVWKNDRLVRRFDAHGPLGYWVRDKFCPVDAFGSECTLYRPAKPHLVVLDQRWRTTASLRINYFWPQNYNTASTDSSLLLDDIVVATRRIGCMVDGR